MRGRRGHIRFGDEEERRESEQLASRMIEEVANQHEIVGSRVKTIHYVTAGEYRPGGQQDLKIMVENLAIELESGFRLTARNAVLQLPAGSSGFGEALRRENARQALAEPETGALREAGEAIMRGTDPVELDHMGDPKHVEDRTESPTAYPVGPPKIEGTEITEET